MGARRDAKPGTTSATLGHSFADAIALDPPELRAA
jgi:hypothetical protein